MEPVDAQKVSPEPQRSNDNVHDSATYDKPQPSNSDSNDLSTENGNWGKEYNNDNQQNQFGDQYRNSADGAKNSYSAEPENEVNKNPGTTLYVSKLNFKTTEEDLYQEFAKHGKIRTCDLIVDPHTKESRCFAFITFETPEGADNALAQTVDLKLDGSFLVVEKSKRCRPRPPTPGRYSGTKPLSSMRDRRPFRDDYMGREFYRPPHHFDSRYPPRDMPPRDRYSDYPPFGGRAYFPPRARDLNDRLGPRDYYPRDDRGPYPPRGPREPPSNYGRQPDQRDFVPRDSRPPRESRYNDFERPRGDPRDVPPPFERERMPPRVRDEPPRERLTDKPPREPYSAPRDGRDQRGSYEY